MSDRGVTSRFQKKEAKDTSQKAVKTQFILRKVIVHSSQLSSCSPVGSGSSVMNHLYTSLLTIGKGAQRKKNTPPIGIHCAKIRHRQPFAVTLCRRHSS